MRLDDFFPSVTSFEPTLTTENVPVRPRIIARFSTELFAEQINTSEKLNTQVFLVEESSDVTIPVEFISYGTRELVFSSSQDLNPGSTYQVTLKAGLLSEQGRGMPVNRSWSFIVSETDIDRVTLLSPPDSTAIPNTPTFYWFPVSSPSPSGTLYYRVELDNDISFNSTWAGWSTLTTATSAIPGVALDSNKTYFWRIRAEVHTVSSSAFGQWSVPFSFYMGSFLQPSPDTRQTYPEASNFQESTSYFDSGLANQSTWPTLDTVFSEDVDPTTVTSTTVYMYRESVDGYPTSQRYSVALTLSVTGNTIYIAPSDSLVANSRYSLYITTGVKDVDGNALPFIITKYFTSHYTPLYVGVNALRANFGQFITTWPDDLLYFQIYRASLDVNREYIFWYSALLGGPTQEAVRNLVIPMTSYAMEKWTELQTMIKLLRTRFYDLSESADEMKRLGDYTEHRGVNILKALQDEIDRLTKESTKWIAEFSRNRARVKNTVKSERYLPYRKGTDWSFQQYRRDDF